MYNRVKQLRQKRNWTQVKLSNHLKISRQHMIKIESGAMPTLDLAFKLSSTFRKPIEQIFSVTERPDWSEPS